MPPVLQKIRSFLNLPHEQKAWFLWGFFFSGFAGAAVALLPFRWLSPYLGSHFQNQKITILLTREQQRLARCIGKITELACRHTPWGSKCLVRAIVAKSLLRFYDIPCVIYIGVAGSASDGDLKAHAWLSAGKRIVTGHKGHQQFKVVSTFVSPSDR